MDREHLIQEGKEDAPRILEAATVEWETLREAREDGEQLRFVPARDEDRAAFVLRVSRLLTRSPGTLAALFVAQVGAGFFLLTVAALAEGQPLRVVMLLKLVGCLVSLAAVRPAWRRGRREAGVQQTAEQAVAAIENYRAALRQAGVDAWVREKINEAREPSDAIELSYGDRSGLAEVDDRNREIPTRTRERLGKLMEGEKMPGGAIGLSGSRGAGKSTLMRALCRSAEGTGGRKEVLGVVVDAPIEYEAREFVLYLFAKVCAKVIGPSGVAELRHRNQRIPSLSSYLASRGALLAVAGLILFGTMQLYDALVEVTIPFTSAIGGFLFVGAGVILLSLVRRFRRYREADTVEVRPGRDAADVATAADHLEEIWFQQSFSSGWSGSFKLPAGLGGGFTNTTELARRQLSFPEVVDLFRAFLEQISSSRQVRIGIDELDKMEDAAAQRFLNEIKVVFRVPGCFFLISISEDAMSSFERRGLPFRDVFDSSFDDVQVVPHLRLKGTKALLDRRIVGLPLAFTCLLHCTSGGLPRDLIRVARDLVELTKETELGEATAKLVGDAVRLKVDAARIAVRAYRPEDHVRVLTEWLGRLAAADADAGALLRLCRGFEADFLLPLATLRPDDDLKGEHREVRNLGTQLATFAYMAATVLELFSQFSDRSLIRPASGIDRGDDEEPATIDRLAGISQAFSADLDTAWTRLSELRADLGLKTIDFPSVSAPLSPQLDGNLAGQAARLLRSVSDGLIRFA